MELEPQRGDLHKLQVQRFLYPNHETGEVIPTGLFLSFAFRLRTDDPYGSKNFRKKSDAFKLRFFITIRYLGFNPGQYLFTAKLKHRTPMVFCLQKAKAFFQLQRSDLFLADRQERY
jgi:hypothetical protein